jgi:acyl-coenzyme A thioesterase PaaI-like protein
VQGGVIAAGFDVVLAMAAGVNGRLGLTRSLTVRYLAPTPLAIPLRYAAGIALEDRRRTTVDGVLLAGDMLVAEATGEFVMPRPPA